MFFFFVDKAEFKQGIRAAYVPNLDFIPPFSALFPHLTEWQSFDPRADELAVGAVV
jgi:hypothetical protein